MSKSYRFRTKLNQDREVRLNIEQDFDMIEILSLKLKQSDVYTRFCADYGVVAGRVIANGGYGVPNVPISIFVPLSAQDENDPVIKTLYPYKTSDQKNEDGYRYNLLPYKPEYGGHTPTGTFPDIEDVLKRKEVLEIYEKYYKYTVRTNESGDFMIVGVPLGMQTIVMDMDLSNIGCFSLRPSDLVRMGMGVESQFAGSQFRSSENIESLPQIINSKKDIEVASFWGETEICDVGITRVDFDLRDRGINIEPQAVFMGSLFSTVDEDALGTNCKPKFDSGNLCDLVSAPGKILAIRQTIYSDTQGLPILEEYKLSDGGNVIDDEGTWLVEVPMNLDFVTTNEFGEQIFSNDPTVGIPTKGKYRFKIQYQNENAATAQVIRADYIVPNIKEYGWRNLSGPDENGPNDPSLQEKSYAFSLDWQDYAQIDPITSGFTTLGQQMLQEALNCDDRFFEFNFNRVYTVSGFLDRWKWGYNRSRHLGIKEITNRDCSSTTNRMPVNDGVRNFDLIFFLFTILMVILQPIFVIIIVLYHFIIWAYNLLVRIVNGFVVFINRIILSFCNIINRIRSWIGWSEKNCEQNLIPAIPTRTFPRISLPMIAYPDCDACNCETVQSEGQGNQPTNDLTLQRVNISLLADTNSIESWGWAETFEYNKIQTYYCDVFPEGCNVTEDAFNFAINQGFAGFSGPTDNGKDKIQKIPIATWPSQDSRVGALGFNVSWGQKLNLMNARSRYLGNESVMTITVKNKDFQNVEQVSDPMKDQPFILICDPGTISQLGGPGTLLSFSDIDQINDPNLTGATLNQFGNNAVTGTTTFNNTALVNDTQYFIQPTYAFGTGLAQLKLKLTGSSQSYNYKAGVEYFQVITGGTLSSFEQYLTGERWESFLGQYVYGGDMKFRWGKGWGREKVFGKQPNNLVRSIALDNIGEIVLGGNFTSYGTQNSQRIVKIDPTTGDFIGLYPAVAFNNNVKKVIINSSNESFVIGGFSSYNNITSTPDRIVKINSDGSENTTFSSNLGIGIGQSGIISPSVEDIIEQPFDGKIIVVGKFDEINNISIVGDNIIRLNSDGTIDGSFNPPSTTYKYTAVAIDTTGGPYNGYIYISKDTISGSQKVQRLTPTGAIDGTFNTTFDNTPLNSSFGLNLKVDTNGKILLGFKGDFVSNSITYKGIIRLNTDGTVDTTFNPNGVGFNNTVSVYAIEIDINNNIVLGGTSNFTYNGVSRTNILRLLPDGDLDPLFEYGSNFSTFPGVVYDLKILSNQTIVIGGDFGSSVSIAQKNIRLLDSFGKNQAGFGWTNPTPTPLTVWNNVARGYIAYVSDIFRNFDSHEIVFLTRGTDPYTPKQTIEYDLSRLFNAPTGTVKVKGEYYLNIPIQQNSAPNSNSQPWDIPGVNVNTWRDSHFTPESHDVINNINPRLYHRPYNNFLIPQNSWTAFTNNAVKYYTSTDKSRRTHKAYNNDNLALENFTSAPGVNSSVNYDWYDGTNTLGISWTIGDPADVIDPLNPIYSGNVVYGQGFIEGSSVMASTVSPGTTQDIEDSSFFARIFAPSYYLENPQYDVLMDNRQRLVLRSDRLPTSTTTEVTGNNSLPLFLNEAFYITKVLENGETFEFSITINQTIDNSNSQDISGDTPSAISDAIINSLSCEGLTSLACYSGFGGNFGVIEQCAANYDGNLQKQRVIGGCYYFVQPDYLNINSINEDIQFFKEWRARFTLTFAACRGVISHVFQNNWLNGSLYAFSFKKRNIFNSQGELQDYNYCGSNNGLINPVRENQGPIYYEKNKNTFIYRCTPYEYQTGKFIGQRPRYKEFFGLGNWVNADFKGMNKRNLYYPTTIMDLGPRDEFAKEICFNPQLDGYLVETIQSSSYNDTSDILLYFILSRLLSSTLGNFLNTGTKQLNALFSREEDRLDGDVVQMFSINSEYGIVPFNDDNYNDDDLFMFGAVNSQGELGPTIGLYFSSNTRNRILLTPGIQTYGTVLQNNGYPKTQTVPMYKWQYDTTSNLFGSELNEWYTDLESGGFYAIPYQKMEYNSTAYFQPQNGTGPFNGATGYIFNYDSNGNPNQNVFDWPNNQANRFVVGAPYHFYFGLGKGKSAINRYISKYIIGE